MAFVTLNKQNSVIKLPDKKLGARRFFVAASLKFGKVRQNFVKAKQVGPTRLQLLLTLFWQSKQKFCLVRPTPMRKSIEDRTIPPKVSPLQNLFQSTVFTLILFTWQVLD